MCGFNGILMGKGWPLVYGT